MTTSAVIPAPSGAADAAAWDLVAAAQAGDHAAFGQLYERYVDVVFRFVLTRTGHRQVAEDLTSETFLRALRGLRSLEFQGRDVGAWFVTIARNLMLDRAKSSRYRLEMTTANMFDTSTDRGLEHEVIDRELSRVLLECIDRLGAEQRTAVLLHHIAGMRVAQVAEVMGKGEQAVKALTHRARVRLADMRELQGLVG